MLKYNSLLLFLGLFLTGVAGLQAADALPVEENAVRCDLPAPENFRITSTTQNSISLAWSPVPGATGYEVRAYSPNSPVPQVLIVFDTTVTFFGLNPLITYDFQVAGICEGEERGAWAYISGKPGSIILDLIADRQGAPQLQEIPPDIPGAHQYTLERTAGVSYWFEIKAAGGPYSRYEVLVPQNMEDFAVRKEREFLATWAYGDVGGGLWNGPLADNALRVRVCYQFNPLNSGIGDLILTDGNLYNFILNWEVISSSFTFKVFKKGGSGLKSGEDRNSPETSATAIQVSPNPFQSEIQIAGLNPNAATTLHLLHSDGRLIQAETTTSQNYNLPTQNLQPGLYFLRIESEGIQKTHKLVKTH